MTAIYHSASGWRSGGGWCCSGGLIRRWWARRRRRSSGGRARRGRGRLRVGSVLYGGFRAWAGALSWGSSLGPVEATASRSDRVCSWRMARYCAPWSGWWIGPVGSALCRRRCRVAVVGASGAGPVGACRFTFRRGCASAGEGGVHPLRERAHGGDVRRPRFVRSGGREVPVHQVCRVLLPWSGPGRSGRFRAAGAGGPIMSRMGRSAVQRVTCRPVRPADGGAVERRAHLEGSRRRAVGLVDLCGPGLEGLVAHAPGRRRAGPGRVEGGRGDPDPGAGQRLADRPGPGDPLCCHGWRSR